MRASAYMVVAGVLVACSPGDGSPPDAGDSGALSVGDGGFTAADAQAASARCESGERRACYEGPAATRRTGTCRPGRQRCEDGRWEACEGAVLPQTDLCDGLDNDCDGTTDEGDPAVHRTCDSEMPGLCASGVALCEEGQLQCAPAFEPRAEQCNAMDDDCDGKSDEDFLSDRGVYLHREHCGACDERCDGTLEGSARERCAQFDQRDPRDPRDPLEGQAVRCEVEACRPGYVKRDALTCERAVPDPCRRCASDDQCANPGDACLELPGERVCGIDCSEDNVYGTPAGQCPEGYGCTSLGDGRRQCVPHSGSCSCLEGDEGETRQCVRSGEAGACVGSQRCEPGRGWSACDAPMPAVESCNGRDDDCDDQVDEGDPGAGGGCSTGLKGNCAAGRLTCTSEGLTCVPRMTPLEHEVCGNQQDDDCDGERDEDCCPHSECEAGEALPALCSSCASMVCGEDAFCCRGDEGGWDEVCIDLAKQLCGSACRDE